MNRRYWLLIVLPLALASACQRADNENLRDAYERMMETAERRAAVESPAPVPTGPQDAEPEPDPGTLPIDTLPRPALPADTAPDDPAVATVEPAPGAFEGTAEAQQREVAGAMAATLRDVRTAEHAGFDRIVFEFDTSVPGYHVAYVDRPIRECGSGRTIPVSGQAWLRVRLDPARSAIDDRNRPLDHGILQQVVMTCESEGRVEWVLAVASPNEYRLLQLSEPARLVVDINQ